MKVSDAIAAFLAQHVKHVFCISGGASLHMIDSIAKRKDIAYVCPQNEQAASFQADAYSRLTGMGCALTTSGPGATNLITGIATSFYDSVPVLYITGQQTRDRLSAGTGCRQIGFQETPITEIVRPITKYAVTVMEPQHTVEALTEAVGIAKEGRPGPVLVDIPDDIQRADMESQFIRSGAYLHGERTWEVDTSDVLDELLQAKRPLFIFGSAVGDVAAAKELIRRLRVPCVTTWGALDHFVPEALCFGGFGTHAARAPNFIVQNADYIVTVGTRLDTKATGSPASAFAPKAKLVMVDIDKAEIRKMDRIGRPLHASYCCDSGAFLRSLLREAGEEIAVNAAAWVEKCKAWRKEFDPVLPEFLEQPGNPYAFVRRLGDLLSPRDTIVSDTGCALGWMAQAFKFSGQRFIHAWNNTPMGYGLPAAVGAAFARRSSDHPRIVLITGDGGLAVNITELATVARHNLPIKIILFNNRGHAMCRQTQRTWLGGTYPATSYEGGLATPDYVEVAKAYGIPAWATADLQSAFRYEGEMSGLLCVDGPALLSLEISPDYQITPQVRAGRLLHDADPPLPREELEGIMA